MSCSSSSLESLSEVRSDYDTRVAEYESNNNNNNNTLIYIAPACRMTSELCTVRAGQNSILFHGSCTLRCHEHAMSCSFPGSID